MHNHSSCKHKLEFCEHCDVVWCSKCKKEWSRNIYTFTYTQPSTTISPKPWSTTIYGMNLSGGTTITNCNHK